MFMKSKKVEICGGPGPSSVSRETMHSPDLLGGDTSYFSSVKKLGHHYRDINCPNFRERCCSVRMRKTKIIAVLGLVLTLSSLLLGSRTLGYQRAVFSLQLGGLFLVLGGFFRLYDNHPMQELLATLYDLEDE